MLRTLLSFWLMPIFGMMFAAGATIGDVGTGGGDGATGDSSAVGGDDSTGGDEGGGDENGDQSGDEALDAGDGADADADQSAISNADRSARDGRKIPQKYQELFKNDKALREMYFSQAALKKAFPGGVREAVQLAKSVEEFGGVEAVQQLQGDLDVYRSDEQLWEKGDPKWVETAFEANPDATLKAFVHSLDYVGEHHPEHYDHLMAKVIINDLNQSLPVREIYDALTAMKDNPGAQQLAKKLADYYNARAATSKKVPEKQIDPQQKKIDQQKADLTKKEQEIRNKSINSEAAPHMQRQIDTVLSKAAKDAGFDAAKLAKEQPNRWGRFLKDAKSAIHANVLGDSKWIERYSAALASNDTAKCVRMLNARHDQAILGAGDQPGVVAPIFHEWFGPPKAGTRQNNGANRAQSQNGNRGGNAGGTGASKESPLLVNSLPAAKEINYNAPETDRWAGIYRLKTGKLIQVRRP